MAVLRGQNALSEVNLLVTDTGRRVKDNGYRVVTIQIDQSLLKEDKVRNGEYADGKVQTNPYLATTERTYKDQEGNDKTVISHDMFVAESVYEKYLEVAKKTTDEKGKEVLGINASLAIGKSKDGSSYLFINPKKPIKETTVRNFDENTVKNQKAITLVAKEVAKAAKENKKEVEAPAKEAKKEAKAKTTEEPTI